MISTKNIITSINDIPQEWIFETYIPGLEKLCGQEITMRSPLTSEKNNSFTLFFEKNQRYFFKCFSSSLGGDGFDFVKAYCKLATKADAITKVKKDYSDFLKNNKVSVIGEYEVHNKFKVTDFQLRKWNSYDKTYWTKYHIGSKTLDFLNVSPMDHFIMSKEEKAGIKTIRITRPLLYGYFDKTGDLCRVYQPGVKEAKCIKVKSFVQGDDQLKYNSENLLITKSMKDIAAFYELQIPNWECIAPESENALLNKKYVEGKKKQYKKIVVLFDNDKAGHDASNEYVKQYEIPNVEFNMGQKDLSDTMEKNPIEKVKEKLIKTLALVIR